MENEFGNLDSAVRAIVFAFRRRVLLLFGGLAVHAPHFGEHGAESQGESAAEQPHARLEIHSPIICKNPVESQKRTS